MIKNIQFIGCTNWFMLLSLDANDIACGITGTGKCPLNEFANCQKSNTLGFIRNRTTNDAHIDVFGTTLVCVRACVGDMLMSSVINNLSLFAC